MLNDCTLFCHVFNAAQEPRVVQLVSHPFLGNDVLRAGPAQFGLNLKGHHGVSIFTNYCDQSLMRSMMCIQFVEHVVTVARINNYNLPT